MLHERLVQTGAVAKSFQAGAQVFWSYTRTPVSEATARRFTERAGAVMDECETERAPECAPEPGGTHTEAAAARAEDRRPWWVGADGAFVRLVGGSWREVRTVTIGRVNPPVWRDGKPQVRTTDLSYFSRLTDGADLFVSLAGVEFQRRGVGPDRLIGAGADGADWCQHLFDQHCPTARRGLDFYHAAERVQAFSKQLWSGSPAMAKWFAEDHLHELKHRGPDRLLGTLQVWSVAAREASIRKAAGEQHGFFSSRKELLDYPALRAAGLPIGTGNAESANLHVLQDRLKGPGKFWAKEHVNPMLALRGAWCSDRWENAWQDASKRLSAGHYPISLFHAPKAKT